MLDKIFYEEMQHIEHDPLMSRALIFAAFYHGDQKRRGTDLPYVSHPINVAKSLRLHSPDHPNFKTLYCAALLHDVLEDTLATYSMLEFSFGKEIADIVQGLTNNRGDMPKNEYLMQKCVKMTDDELYIKLLDRLDNISDRPGDGYKKKTAKLLKHIEENRALLPLHKDVMTCIYLCLDK